MMSGREDEGEGQVNKGFVTPIETWMSVYRMMLGDLEREWFPDTLTLAMFCVYTFVGNIMMLNVLIAVVSDPCKRSPSIGPCIWHNPNPDPEP